MLNNSKTNKLVRKPSGSDNLLRLPAKVLHQIICKALEDALDSKSGIPTDANGYVDGEVLSDIILEEQEKMLPQKEWSNYTTVYKPNELITKGINPVLKQIGKEIFKSAGEKKGSKRGSVRPSIFKGYKGLLNDYISACVMHNQTPVDKETFNFIKGTLDFDTMAAIRNRIKDITDAAWEDYCRQNPKFNTNKVVEREVKSKFKPDGPFLCIEGSVYEFTPEYTAETERERGLLLQFADAIIYKKVVEVTYQAFHYDHPDKLEFHAHYIRKVGNKLMVYGRSRSIKFHKPDEYTLVNLIVGRVKEVRDYPEPDKHYFSAKELGLDYNNTLFRNRMTFNAPGYNSEDADCTEIILKVKKNVPTANIPRKPFDRLKAEPLHHSQKVYEGIPEDDDFGYLSLFVSDYIFIRPILMSWGSDIQVVKPDNLRQQMEREICRMVEMYGIQFTTVPVAPDEIKSAHDRITDVEITDGEGEYKYIRCKVDGILQTPKRLYPEDAKIAEDETQLQGLAERYYVI